MLWCLAGQIVNYPFALPDKNRIGQNRTAITLERRARHEPALLSKVMAVGSLRLPTAPYRMTSLYGKQDKRSKTVS